MQRRKSVRLTFATLCLCLGSSSSAGVLPAVVEGAIAANLGNQQPGRIAQTDSRKAEADRLLQQGIQQYQTSQFEAALQSWQQALQLYRQIKDRRGEGQSLGNLGLAYFSLGNYPQAIAYQEQRLAIAREIKDPDGERIALNNIAVVLEQQQQPELAILFYKESVNVVETICTGLKPLSRELQESYTQPSPAPIGGWQTCCWPRGGCWRPSRCWNC